MATVSMTDYLQLQAKYDQLAEMVATNTKAIAETVVQVGSNERDMDSAYLVITGAIVFFMQAGFAMLEAGCVGKKNVINILFKNIMDGSIAAICFWLLGWGFAYGETAGGFVGTSDFALSKMYYGAGDDTTPDGFNMWFFQWAFVGTAATIVSGSVAERTKFEAYLLFSAVMSSFIYPVIVHWGWGNGWLSKEAMPDEDGFFHPLLKGNQEESNGLLDFGGSGVVHMLGGISGLCGAILVGPRLGRFDSDGRTLPLPGHNTTMMALGTSILWFGWYGFNCGSTLAISSGSAQVAGKVAVTTTISGASGCLMATIVGRIFEKTFDIGVALNGILAALVGITAGCAVVEPWSAFLIGSISAWVYYGAHRLLLRLNVDDPLDAFPIHGCCGAWGLISTGIFCVDSNVSASGSNHSLLGNDACARGEQFGVQLIAVLSIASWSAAMSGGTFYLMNKTMGLRVPGDVEEEGLDISEHGGSGYPDSVATPTNRVAPMIIGTDDSLKGPTPGNRNAVHAISVDNNQGWGALADGPR